MLKIFKKNSVALSVSKGGKVYFNTEDTEMVTKALMRTAAESEEFFIALMSAASWIVADNPPVTRARLVQTFSEKVKEAAKILNKQHAAKEVAKLKVK